MDAAGGYPGFAPESNARASWAGLVRIGAAHALPQVLRDLGADPRALCAAAGVDVQLFDDPDALVPYPTMARLLDLCVEQTGCEHIGLAFGQKNTLSALGLIGYYAKNSPDVESALRALVEMLHHHDRGGAPSMSVENGVVSLAFAIYQSHLPGMSQIADTAMATACNFLRELCGLPSWRPSEVRLTHAAPRDPRPLERFFRAPLRFDAEENALIFPAKWLRCPVSGADAQLLRILKQQVTALARADDRSLPDALRGVLRTMLLSGKSSADDVAKLLGMHRRTLNRRLKAEGVAFERLRDEVRFEIARQMLSESRAPLIQIATMLNYSDVSSFNRAFHRWSGATPSQWREDAGRGSRRDPARKSGPARAGGG